MDTGEFRDPALKRIYERFLENENNKNDGKDPKPKNKDDETDETQRTGEGSQGWWSLMIRYFVFVSS